MRVFVPNLTFENDLSGQRNVRSKATEQVVTELAPAIGIMAEAGDVVLVSPAPELTELPDCLAGVRFLSNISSSNDSELRGQIKFIPFGWTDDLRKMALDHGIQADDFPGHDCVYHVNCREFNATHDIYVGDDDLRMPFLKCFGRLCRNVGEWRTAASAVRSSGFSKWVAKPAISHAGRNRLIADSIRLNQQQHGWLDRQFSESGYVYVEPWVVPLAEWGLQFEITSPAAGGGVQHVGTTKLINDSVGRYQGSVIGAADQRSEELLLAVEHGRRVCLAAEEAGYFGPVGIDCFQFSDPDGRIGFRLCNDINARFTMGRIALHLKNSLKPNEFAFWGQFRTSTLFSNLPSVRNSPDQTLIDGVRVVVTSPFTIQGRLVRTLTVLLSGQSEAIIHRVRKSLLKS